MTSIALLFVNETTYTGDPTILSYQLTREWIHSLSAVLGGLIAAGLLPFGTNPLREGAFFIWKRPASY
ncbi:MULTISPECIES: hypothetical protein [Bradyrhizobium]|jgi:hypothetical protein|uniref:hypothetical protein n=1 Tax=Bradyrhizobium TaxID=374 RepID=UPI000231D9A3|nr:hypothetical protein [Bradyrhizobium japonicum]AJA64856.1 hypothetical protein RN69_34495 [Bradyrhizobium japonicum]KMJ97484.1 hypothetical protein CF64_22685 [Bradyrhizobium japonicum]MBR0764501.1 hypothetical protein [Bradyrhizobium japonicum]MCS3538177.1 hypothetical protein [Bradyrhizobium japonicum]MCS3985736.1 hypothetical protein [Bradyrhizobium japonicum]